MPFFKLKANELNKEIAKCLAVSEPFVNVADEGNEIRVNFQYGLTISRIILSSVQAGLTDKEWRNLTKEIKNTLTGAKMQASNSDLISIQPLRSEWMHIRLNPVERALILDAAKVQRRTVADFARSALLKVADEVYAAEKLKETERETEEKREKAKTYVS